MNKDYFKLFANCIIVNGYSKSTICDLFKGRYRDIPNEIARLINKEGTVALKEIKEKFDDKEDQDGVFLFLDYFVKNDWAFYTNTPDFFPKLNTTWMSPSNITNAIIDIDEESDFDLNKCIREINDLGCTGIQFRFYSKTNPKQFDIIAESVSFLEFEYVELISKFNDKLNSNYYDNFIEKHRRISKLIITGTVKNISSKRDDVFYLNEDIDFCNDCGIINKLYFTPNIEHFTESTNFNNCLNKKISIDTKGNIRNCPSMKQSFGNIKQNPLQSIISDDEFTSIWKLKKDDIEICKDCEYRYICSDCRAFTENGGLKSKPSKCNYNPYKGIWND